MVHPCRKPLLLFDAVVVLHDVPCRKISVLQQSTFVRPPPGGDICSISFGRRIGPGAGYSTYPGDKPIPFIGGLFSSSPRWFPVVGSGSYLGEGVVFYVKYGSLDTLAYAVPETLYMGDGSPIAGS